MFALLFWKQIFAGTKKIFAGTNTREISEMTLFLVIYTKIQTFHNIAFLCVGTPYRRVRWQKGHDCLPYKIT